MRCLTLAQSLAARGAEIAFASTAHPGNTAHRISGAGYRLHLLEPVGSGPQEFAPGRPVHAAWLGCSWNEDAAQSLEVLLQGGPLAWLVVDHYALDAPWERALRDAHQLRFGVPLRILAIDDLADRSHDCDVLLDQNHHDSPASRYCNLVPPDALMLLGPTYALLRPEFRVARERMKLRSGDVKRIMISLGGIDRENWTGVAIDVLKDFRDLSVDVVIGENHPMKDTITSDCRKLGFICHVQTPSISRVMAEADLAIGAGGSATWERCCLGLPSIAISVAPNQVALSQSLADVGGCVHLAGDHLTPGDLRGTLIELMADPDRRSSLSKVSSELVDGLGTDRVVDVMYAHP